MHSVLKQWQWLVLLHCPLCGLCSQGFAKKGDMQGSGAGWIIRRALPGSLPTTYKGTMDRLVHADIQLAAHKEMMSVRVGA
jgi:hypothetical protein